MIDKWFLEDIENQIKYRKRIVILDPKGQCGFLLPLLDSKRFCLIKTDAANTEEWQTVKEELFLRYEAETQHKNKEVIFYVTRDIDKLSFLFDYCFTHGCLDLSRFSEWIKNQLFKNTGLQVQMNSQMLLTAAKLSIGKDIAWWKKILQNLESLINLEDELLPFLHDPEAYLKSKDKDIYNLFEKKVFELLNQPYMTKPPVTLANEIVKKLLDSLADNTISANLIDLYYRWTDSETYRPSLINYVNAYQLNHDIDPWSAHPDHCFEIFDKKMLKQLAVSFKDSLSVSEKLCKIKARAGSRVKTFVPSWWQDVITLIEFNNKRLSSCNSLSKVIEFYTGYFSKADRAIRNLYTSFLHEDSIIRPLQEHYESLNNALLDKWFNYADQYKSDQQGYLVNLFKKAKAGTAVIVGDGIRYEIADFVASSLEKQFKTDKQIMLSEMPSETQYTMSALYANNEIIPNHKEREKRLSEAVKKKITYKALEALSYGEKADFLVLTYRDIDDTGEKLQQGAVKLFQEFEEVLKEKIIMLFNMGFKEVHLVTDHGFVLTGLLDESDKIKPDATGIKEVHERYLLTVDKQDNSNLVSFQKTYENFKFIYASKSHRPFISKGAYGYSHGGFTPQEIIIPKFVFRKLKTSSSGLKVSVINKKELESVAGELFVIKLQAASSSIDINRKVKVMLYSDNVNYSSSNIVLIKLNKIEFLEFSFDRNTEVKAVLVDAENQEQLDSLTIKKSNERDLGGLL
ncbi:MAG: PglZ domain-containing protein [Desulfobacterales bacterium]|nr:PglZ domain-containing protein [Desulfobacterales bacterium]